MTREKIINGLKFTIEMFLLNPNTGETITEPINDIDKVTIDACRGAIELLEQEPCDDAISRQAVDILVDELARAISDERGCMSRGRSTATIMQNILDLPSVTPKQKTGHWIKCDKDKHGYYTSYCSACNQRVQTKNKDFFEKYCNDCGAKMIESEGKE